MRGSSGLIVLTRERRPLTLALWPFSWTEIGSIDIRSTSQGLRTNVRTDLAGDPPDGTGLAYSGLYLHLEAVSWGAGSDRAFRNGMQRSAWPLPG